MSDADVIAAGGRWVSTARNLIMGVVNASPESFSDGGRYASVGQQFDLAAGLVEAGADIIDVGGQSAVTNQPEIAAATEIDRVQPLVAELHRAYPELLISIDTYKLPVARAAVEAGATIVNDVSGLADPRLAELCAVTGSALVVMHTSAPPKVRRQGRELYGDVTAEVVRFLRERMAVAVARGLDARAIVLDPGPDFTKTPHQTVTLLREIDQVRALGRPVLLALSRKDFLGAILRRTPRGRDVGTIAALAHFAARTGFVLRVHDVAGTRDVLDTLDALTGRQSVDPDYVLPDELRYEPSGSAQPVTEANAGRSASGTERSRQPEPRENCHS